MRLFFSYDHADETVVTEIASKLRDSGGYDIWLDRLLVPGERWKKTLGDKILWCDAMLFAISPDSLESEWCTWERIFAKENHKDLVPILVRATRDIPADLLEIQYVDFSKGLSRESFLKLAAGLNRITQEKNTRHKSAYTTDQLDTQNVNAEIRPRVSNTKRIVAGPGTGKTTYILSQVAHLTNSGTDPRSILVVTFTRTAAQEIETSLLRREVPKAESIKAGTLHSVCFDFLNRAHVFLQTGRYTRPLLNFEQRFLLEDLGGSHHFGNYRDRAARLKALEAGWARELSDKPGWPTARIDQEFEAALNEWLRFHEAMLVSEVIPETLKYLRNNPLIRDQLGYKHVFVDEYQDLNLAEQSLIELLSENGELTVVGDEDQSIYERFRYAHPESVYSSDPLAPVEQVELSTCYRCPGTIVKVANHLIGHNSRRMGRQLQTKADGIVGDISIVQWPNMESEADGIARYIETNVSSGRFDLGQVLVLCPRRQFGYLIRDELLKRGLQAHSFFTEELFDGNPKKAGDHEAQSAFTLLALAVNSNDRVALRCWLGFGRPDLARGDYQMLRNYCTQHTLSPISALGANTATQVVSFNNKVIERFHLLRERLDELRNKSAIEVLDMIFPQSAEWALPFRDLALVGGIDEHSEISNLLNVLRTGIIQPERPTDVDFIRVMSIHKSKGLTADHVILAGCIEGLLPTLPDEGLSPAEQDRYIEEQRRLFYVALTRCRQSLVISSVTSIARSQAHRMRLKAAYGDRTNFNTTASRFINELGPSSPNPVRGSQWVY